MYKIVPIIVLVCLVCGCADTNKKSKMYISKNGTNLLIDNGDYYSVFESITPRPIRIYKNNRSSLETKSEPLVCWNKKDYFSHQIKIDSSSNSLILNSIDTCVENYLKNNDAKEFTEIKTYVSWDSILLSRLNMVNRYTSTNSLLNPNSLLTLDDEIQLLLQTKIGPYFNGSYYDYPMLITIYKNGIIIYKKYGDCSVNAFDNIMRLAPVDSTRL